MQLGTASEWLPTRIARFSDGLLDVVLLGFALWTVIYHVSLILHIGTTWAVVAALAGLLPVVWLALSPGRPDPAAGTESNRIARRPVSRALVLVQSAAALLAGLLVAVSDPPWPITWLALVLAASGATVLALRRGDESSGGSPQRSGPGAAVASVSAVGLAVLSLFLVQPDPDDAYHVRLSSWVAAHGRFPLRDVLFSNETFPAIIFPPTSSFEGLVGAVARATATSAPTLTYLVVTPIASALAVLSIWRLLRTWQARSAGLTLGVGLAFLLLDAQSNLTPGNLFVTRLWQGKVIFAAVLVPLFFALLATYIERPHWRQLVKLAASGVAAVGLTASAALVVPVLAAGCLLPVARRHPRRAGAAFAATIAYPVVTLLVTAALGSRRARLYENVGAFAPELLDFVAGSGLVAVTMIVALLVAPRLIPSSLGARMTTTTVLLIVCLLAPSVVSVVFDATGIGRVLWRWTWAAPTAALVGILATHTFAQTRSTMVRTVFPVVLVGALFFAGTPIWSETAGTSIENGPALKRHPSDLSIARRILDSHPNGTVLAPEAISQTVLVMSGTATTVAPRFYYAAALEGVRGAHAQDRLLLHMFANRALEPGANLSRRPLDAPAVRRALRTLDVDVGCVPTRDVEAVSVLRRAGYSAFFDSNGITCMQADS